jgi:hypothetical protein
LAGSTARCSRSVASGAGASILTTSIRLLAVLQLFCGMLIFNGSRRRHVRQLARDVRAGRYEPKIEKQEADLYMNPRRVR